MKEISVMIEEAKGISDNTDAMRLAIIRIAKIVQPATRTAGIKFGGSNTWESVSDMDKRTYRIVAGKHDEKWGLFVEYTDAIPEYHDGSNWVGWADAFGADADAHGLTGFLKFEEVKRSHIEESINRLSEFFDEYVETLKAKHMKYAELKEKVESMSAAIKEDTA